MAAMLMKKFFCEVAHAQRRLTKGKRKFFALRVMKCFFLRIKDKKEIKQAARHKEMLNVSEEEKIMTKKIEQAVKMTDEMEMNEQELENVSGGILGVRRPDMTYGQLLRKWAKKGDKTCAEKYKKLAKTATCPAGC